MAAGAENDLAFKGSAIGTAKMRSDMIGQTLRTEFETMARLMIEWAAEGIPINPDQVQHPDPIVQAAWRVYVGERFDRNAKRRPLDPPSMPTDAEIEARAVASVVPLGAAR